MLDIDVNPEIPEINWSDDVLMHSWSGFCTCSICCKLAARISATICIQAIIVTLSFLVAMKNQLKLVLCIHNIHA